MGELQEKKLLEKSRKYAEENDLMLNPDKRIVDAIIKGLLKREAEKGELYCPVGHWQAALKKTTR